jgi:hypothetical protein
MAGTHLADKILLHQAHPAKLAADVTASVVSDVLLWKARPKAALAVRVLLPVTGSLAVLGLADLDGLASTARGRYVLAHINVRRFCQGGLAGAPACRWFPA